MRIGPSMIVERKYLKIRVVEVVVDLDIMGSQSRCLDSILITEEEEVDKEHTISISVRFSYGSSAVFGLFT